MFFLKQGKTNFKYIFIVLILALLVGGGILWWIKTQEVSFTQLPEIKEPGKIVQNETADWKTYRSLTYKYEVKYPSDWRVSPSLHKDPKGGDWWVEFTPDVPPGSDFSRFFSIIVLKETAQTLKEAIGEKPSAACLAGRCSEANFYKDSETTLGNFSGIRREIIYKDFPGPSVVIESYILNNKLLFTIKFTKNGNDKITSEDENFYNQMLLNFRFVE